MIPFPIIDVPLICVNEAAIEFHVPAKLIISVLQAEQGKVGQIVNNANGTYDIGPMQINSSILPELRRYGISQNAIQYDACVNVKVGAWILSKKIANRGDLLIGVGDYNSHTPVFNKRYTEKIRINYTYTNSYLKHS